MAFQTKKTALSMKNVPWPVLVSIGLSFCIKMNASQIQENQSKNRGIGLPSACCTLSQATSRETAVPDSFRFGWISDVHFGKTEFQGEVLIPERWLETALDCLFRQKIDFLFMGGDVIEKSNTVEQYAEFEKHMRTNIFWYPMPGNHDIGAVPSQTGIRLWLSRGYGKGDPKRDYYGIRYRNAAFFILNTLVFSSTDSLVLSRADAQLAEMRNFFRHQKDAGIRVVCGHVPLFIKTVNEPDAYFNIPGFYRDQIVRIMEEYQVSVFLSGHRHVHDESLDSGIRVYANTALSFQLGTGNRRGYYIYTVFKDSLRRNFYPL